VGACGQKKKRGKGGQQRGRGDLLKREGEKRALEEGEENPDWKK